MKCPHCNSDNLRVIDTRKFDTVIVRIRFCPDCLYGFRTHEEIYLCKSSLFEVVTSDSKIPNSSH